MILTLLGLMASAAAAPVVSVSGVVSYTGAGPLVVQILQVGDAQVPLLVREITIEAPGPFSVSVPSEIGLVRVRVAVDLEDDGVGEGDPQGLSPVFQVSGEGVDDVVVTVRRPDVKRPDSP